MTPLLQPSSFAVVLHAPTATCPRRCMPLVTTISLCHCVAHSYRCTLPQLYVSLLHGPHCYSVHSPLCALTSLQLSPFATVPLCCMPLLLYAPAAASPLFQLSPFTIVLYVSTAAHPALLHAPHCCTFPAAACLCVARLHCCTSLLLYNLTVYCCCCCYMPLLSCLCLHILLTAAVLCCCSRHTPLPPLYALVTVAAIYSSTITVHFCMIYFLYTCCQCPTDLSLLYWYNSPTQLLLVCWYLVPYYLLSSSQTYYLSWQVVALVHLKLGCS